MISLSVPLDDPILVPAEAHANGQVEKSADLPFRSILLHGRSALFLAMFIDDEGATMPVK